jgi:hypothetical protein
MRRGKGRGGQSVRQSGGRGSGGGFVDGDADAFATEHEPHDAEFPVLEPVDLGVRSGIEVEERTGSDEVFATAFAVGEEEWDVGDLFGDDVDSAIDPSHLLIGVGENGTGVGT